MFQQTKIWRRFRYRPAGIWSIFALVLAVGAAVPPEAAEEKSSPLVHQKSLESIYQAREGRPIWISLDGRLNASGSSLLSVLRNADQEGLRPDDYHVQTLADLVDRPDLRTPFIPISTRELIEPLLTDAFLAYGLDLSLGSVEPGLIYSRWGNSRNLAGTVDALADILVKAPAGWETPCFDPTLALGQVRPDQFDYPRLQNALAYYRWVDQTGGWPVVPAGGILRPGDRDLRVTILRARLTEMAGPEAWLSTARKPFSFWNGFAGALPRTLPPEEPDFLKTMVSLKQRIFWVS